MTDTPTLYSAAVICYYFLLELIDFPSLSEILYTRKLANKCFDTSVSIKGSRSVFADCKQMFNFYSGFYQRPFKSIDFVINFFNGCRNFGKKKNNGGDFLELNEIPW